MMRAILFSTLLLVGSLVSGCGNSDGNSQGNTHQNSQSHITEAQVRQYYSDQAAALRNNDAQAICDGMAAEYHQVDITQIVGGDPEHTGTFNKTKACETARESIVLYQRLRDAGTPAVFTENIDSITIARARGCNIAAAQRSAVVRFSKRIPMKHWCDVVDAWSAPAVNRATAPMCRIDAASSGTLLTETPA
jgi:ketosteroid isomerase-like protein